MQRLKLTIIIWLLIFGSTEISVAQTKLPILVLATSADFGTYTCEILKTEGFNEFKTDSLTNPRLTLSYLKQYDMVILAESAVMAGSADLLRNYVMNGGNLIAFQPDKVLSVIFGVKAIENIISNGYIRIDTKCEQGHFLTGKSMQFHGSADKYKVTKAGIIAEIFEKDSSGKAYPAVVSNLYGKGHAIAFFYNLPKSIVFTRQGNPLLAGTENDGIPGMRGMDLFTGGWVDTSKNTMNQADQQMALLSRCIHYLSQFSKPLPRFWYFPDTLKSLVVLDNDGEQRNEENFEPQFQDVDSLAAKMTLYVKDVDKVSKAWVEKWKAKGFEIAGHPDDTQEAEHPTWNGMDSALALKIGQIKSSFDIFIHTNVNHWFVWLSRDASGVPDFAAQALLEQKNGIGMDANYANYDMNSNQPSHYLGTPGWNQGNYTGSGLIMKYASATGKIIQVYQRHNAVYDQQYNECNDPEGYFSCFKGLLDRSIYEGVYSFVSIKAHNDEYSFSKKPLLKMLAYAKQKGVPVWTAEKLLDFLKMKDAAGFENITWASGRLSFTVHSTLSHSNKLSFLVPEQFGVHTIKGIAIDGESIPVIIQKVKGMRYAISSILPGKNYLVTVDYH